MGREARFQLADEAVVQARRNVGFAGFAQVQVGKGFPDRHGQVAHPGVADAAPAAHEAGERDARHAVGEQKVQVFVERQTLQGVLESGAGIHAGVMGVK